MERQVTFETVYRKELEYLKRRRTVYRLEIAPLEAAGQGGPHVRDGTAGLALSGGGIRSATFSLGVVQALARLDRLKDVDYLSTVSGGGYLGACMTSLLTSDPAAGVRPATSPDHPFLLGFTGGDREREEIRHLRNYSNYLAPRHGPFRLETWRLVSAYLGALLLNLVPPLAMASFVFVAGTIFISRLMVSYVGRYSLLQWTLNLLAAAAGVWFLALYFFSRTKRARDGLTTGAAYTIAAIVIPAFLVAAPSAYVRLVDLALRAQSISLETLVPVLAALAPAAALGYVKRSIRVFVVALGMLVGAILVVHLGRSLYIRDRESLQRAWPILLGIVGLSGFLINVNRISLLNFYRDRLADCYMIRRGRDGSTVQTSESLRLTQILPADNGPYHLINATVNLSGSRDLSLRGRMCADFFFSRYYCGSSRSTIGYEATETYAGGRLDVATTMAISGAAVSPQRGSQTQPGLAVLLALLNLRLGQWLPNPNRSTRAGWVYWNYFFFKELFSRADENDWFVLVSDGGHFENTGIYPLLQRRCRTIIAVDAGADPHRQFEDLAGLIRKARIDLGIEIRIDLRDLHGDPMTRRAKAAAAVGTIVYPDPLGAGEESDALGQLIYIKPTLTEGETSEDLLQYARAHPSFPHESTVDQFFDEAQFESYRQLGYQTARDVWRAHATPTSGRADEMTVGPTVGVSGPARR